MFVAAVRYVVQASNAATIEALAILWGCELATAMDIIR